MQIGYFTERPYRWIDEEEVLQNKAYFAIPNERFGITSAERTTTTTSSTSTSQPKSSASTPWRSTSTTATRTAWAA